MNKLRRWSLVDWKSLRNSAFVLIILFLGTMFMFYYSDWKRKFDARNYTKYATANLIAIKPNESISMTETGNKIVVDSYDIRYRFSVKNVNYESIDIIPNSTRNKSLMTQLYNEKNKKLKIKYDPTRPSNSVIIKPFN